MRRISILGAALLLLLGQAAAQDDEAKFNQRQADQLNAFAKRAFRKGFPRQAKLIWLQTLKLYDHDDPDAHAALGHIRSGATWVPDPAFEYPTTDTGTSRDAAALFKAYEKLKKDLARGHSAQAQKWEKASRTDRSRHHFEMVLRWVKTNAKAQAALNHTEIGAVSGTDLERTVYDRSKMIEKAVTDQAAIDYPVETVEDSPQAYLDRAKVPYITVRSEHFTLRGDPEEEQHLREAAVWGERALRVVQAAFPAESFPGDLSSASVTTVSPGDRGIGLTLDQML